MDLEQFRDNMFPVHWELVLTICLPVRQLSDQRVGGIVVSIAAFQAVDPGSIPGRRSLFFCLNILIIQSIYLFIFVLHYINFLIIIWK